MSVTHLVIPDPHAHPDHDNARFEWLGKFIVDLKPDVIVCLGDFADMPSLFRQKYITKSLYERDIEVARDAMVKLLKPLSQHNQKLKQNKKKKWMPRMVMTLGNHEERINRAEGGFIAHLPYKHWEVHPYQDIVEIDGVCYSHSFISGVMAQPIGGENPASAILAKHHTSCTAGHSHLLDYTIRTTAQGKQLHGLVAGVYTDHPHDYAGPANKLWWRGVVVKRNVKDGQYDPEFVSIKTLEERYAN